MGCGEKLEKKEEGGGEGGAGKKEGEKSIRALSHPVGFLKLKPKNALFQKF